MKVAIIGGGAGGFFSAIQVKNYFPKAQVILFEKSNKVLSKVKISGGGRCNVTNGEQNIKTLAKGYPRGEKFLKKCFPHFSSKETFEWFEERGVKLKVESDGRVFPISNNSQSIVDCLMKEILQKRIEIKLSSQIISISKNGEAIKLFFRDENKNQNFDKVIIATGGAPKLSGFDWLSKLNHTIEKPVPSLFTFNIPNNNVTKLMGLSMPNAIVMIPGTKLKSVGPVLITHWGLSGPGVLKLSAFGARVLSEKDYSFVVHVNWIHITNQEIIFDQLKDIQSENKKKQLSSIKPFDLPERLWIYFLTKCDLNPLVKWEEIGKKSLNKLVRVLSNDAYQVHGKTTFKEEFVTCGGISLKEVNPYTLESRIVKNVYFSGEVLDIDGITGGYNFQSAWTTAFIAGQLKTD